MARVMFGPFCTAHRHPAPPVLIVYDGPFLCRETAEAEADALERHGQPGAIVIAAADREAAATRPARLLGPSRD